MSLVTFPLLRGSRKILFTAVSENTRPVISKTSLDFRFFCDTNQNLKARCFLTDLLGNRNLLQPVQKIMVCDLWMSIHFVQCVGRICAMMFFCVTLSFHVLAFTFFCPLTETWQVQIPKVKLFLQSFQIHKKHRYVRVKTNQHFPANI